MFVFLIGYIRRNNMHCCGNIFHDGPIWLAYCLAFLPAATLYIRSFLSARKHFSKKKCDCKEHKSDPHHNYDNYGSE